MEVGRVGNEVSGGSLDGALIDRSKVKILLCDTDPDQSCQSVVNLLCKCSYQVTSVRSARQVVDALNAEGPNIDIILMEADLPMAKGMKLLKHITRDENLQRIPVIMMSAVDEVSLVFKSLRLGAVDFLVKPLRTNELLNLWTHMWRRRRMLGLEEKSILSSESELIGSDLSNEDTNSATLVYDAIDNTFSENAVSEKGTHQDDETSFAAEISSAVEGTSIALIACGASNVIYKSANPTSLLPGDMHASGVEESSHNQSGPSFFTPVKSKLNIGNSSAFFTYNRPLTKEDPATNLKECDRGGSLTKDNCKSYPYSSSVDKSQTTHIVSELSHHQYSTEDEPSDGPTTYASELQAKKPELNPHSAYSKLLTGMKNPHFQDTDQNDLSDRPTTYASELEAKEPGLNPHSAYSKLLTGMKNPHFQDTDQNDPSDRPTTYASELEAKKPGLNPHSAYSKLLTGMTNPYFQDTDQNDPSDRPSHANDPQASMSGFNQNSAYPYLTPGITNQMIMPHFYPQFNQSFVHYPPYMPPMMVSYPSAYTSRVGLQTCHLPNATPSPNPITNPHDAPPILNYISKREAALIKFRRKRNERSFDKKIRYVNRKNLAESRPRVKGQFVSKLATAVAINGISAKK